MEAEAGKPEGIETVEWSAEDLHWLDNAVTLQLRGMAMRYGRPLFSMAFRIGLMNHCITVLSQRLEKNKDLSQMLTMLSMAANENAMLALKEIGFTPEQLLECKESIERVGQLSQGTPQSQAAAAGKKVSPGGIILDS